MELVGARLRNYGTNLDVKLSLATWLGREACMPLTFTASADTSLGLLVLVVAIAAVR